MIGLAGLYGDGRGPAPEPYSGYPSGNGCGAGHLYANISSPETGVEISDGWGVGYGIGEDNQQDEVPVDDRGSHDFIFTVVEDDLKHTVTNTVAFNHLFTQGETP